ncbi:MAG: hypothetical protein ACREFL_22530, partial [Stellaceae bacterium]
MIAIAGHKKLRKKEAQTQYPDRAESGCFAERSHAAETHDKRIIDGGEPQNAGLGQDPDRGAVDA